MMMDLLHFMKNSLDDSMQVHRVGMIICRVILWRISHTEHPWHRLLQHQPTTVFVASVSVPK